VAATGPDVVRVVPAASGGQPVWKNSHYPLPANATNHLDSAILASACPVTGWCVAVGEYDGTGGIPEGLIEILSGGAWTPTEAPLPASGTDGADLIDVSCSAIGSCIAIGNYVDPSELQQGLIETLAGGVWTPVEASLPDGAGPDPAVYLETVACADEGDCVAIGTYRDTNGFGQGLLETLSAGT